MTTFTPTELVMGFVLWDIQQQTQSAETGPGKGKKTKPKKIAASEVVAALSDCIKTLWGGIAILNSLSPTAKGISGSANITYLDGDHTVQTNNVVNSIAFTGTQLGNLYEAVRTGKRVSANQPPLNGLSFSSGPRTVSGETFYATALQNYTASDRNRFQSYFPVLGDQIGPYFATQIHELGNSIRNLTGVYVGDITGNNPANDKDSGYQLHKCVADKLTGGK